MVFITSVQNILPIILLIALGYILQSKRYFADSFGGDISKFLINIGLPMSVFVSLLKYISKEELLALSRGLLFTIPCFVILYTFAFALAKIFNVPRGRRAIFINAIVNGNTVFIGFPLNLAFFGEEVLPYFLVYYLTSTISTWGIGATLISLDDPTIDRAAGVKIQWRKLIPIPLIGMLVAIFCILVQIRPPAVILSTMGYIGSTVTPFSLIYIGIALARSGLGTIRLERDALLVLFGKFLFAPLVMTAVILSLGKLIEPLPTLAMHSYIVQSSAPVFASLTILAHEAKSDEKFATGVITLSTLLFVFVAPIVMTFVQRLG